MLQGQRTDAKISEQKKLTQNKTDKTKHEQEKSEIQIKFVMLMEIYYSKLKMYTHRQIHTFCTKVTLT